MAYVFLQTWRVCIFIIIFGTNYSYSLLFTHTERLCSNYILRSSFAWIAHCGTTYHRQAEVRPHRQHHARRPPLASGTTTYPVQAEYVSQQVPSSYCTVVPHRHVHSGVNSIWSLVSTVVLTPGHENLALSTVVMRITQLFRVWPHNLELATSHQRLILITFLFLQLP